MNTWTTKELGWRAHTLTRRQVVCPNATLLGYSKGTARYGDIVAYQFPDGTQTFTGRMLGRIDAPAEYHPTTKETIPACKGWLCILTFNETLTGAYPRWVNPAWVRDVRSMPQHIPALLMAPKLPWSAETLLRLAAYGTLSEPFAAHAAERVDAWTRDEPQP